MRRTASRDANSLGSDGDQRSELVHDRYVRRQRHVHADGAVSSDKDGAPSARSPSRSCVTNVAPTADVGQQRPGDRGQPGDRSLSAEPVTPRRPTPRPASTTFTLHYGRPGAAPTPLPTHRRRQASPSTTMVATLSTGAFFDKDGGFTDAATTVTVLNVAPTAALVAPAAVEEALCSACLSPQPSTRPRPTPRSASTTQRQRHLHGDVHRQRRRRRRRYRHRHRHRLQR